MTNWKNDLCKWGEDLYCWTDSGAKEALLALVNEMPTHTSLSRYEKSLMREFVQLVSCMETEELTVVINKSSLIATFDSDDERHDADLFSITFTGGGHIVVSYDGEMIQQPLLPEYRAFALDLLRRYEKNHRQDWFIE